MKSNSSLLTIGLLLATASLGQATIIGFGQLFGNNTTVLPNLASNATEDGNGFVVSNGTTPDIALVWDGNWDIHTSNFFGNIENQTVGGSAWDDEGAIPRVAQLDTGNHTIDFNADPGFAVILNSFDFGHTPETAGTAVWDITLTNSASTVVWSSLALSLTNTVVTLAPAFTGALGEDYKLTFNRVSETYNSNGRHAIDNLSFSQVPEASSATIAGLAGMALLLRRRR